MILKFIWKTKWQVSQKGYKKEASIIFVKCEVRIDGNKTMFIRYFQSRNLYSDLIHLKEIVGMPCRGIFSSSHSGLEGGIVSLPQRRTNAKVQGDSAT